MKNIFILSLLFLVLLTSCGDGSNVVTVNPDGTVTSTNPTIREQLEKQKKLKDSLNKTDTVLTVKTDTITSEEKNLTVSDTGTVKEPVEIQSAELNKKLNEVQIQTSNPNFKLPKSTYKVRRYEQVSEILSLLYERKSEIFKQNGVPTSVISGEYVKFFTIEYCDDRVLEFLDELCREENMNTATKFTIDYDAIFETKNSKTVIKKNSAPKKKK